MNFYRLITSSGSSQHNLIIIVYYYNLNILYCRLLRQVLNEVLRLTVLGPFAGRYSDDDVMIGDYLIPAGTTIVIALGVALNNETIWKNVEK